ncbi:MAG: PrsW family glutamic-type intramembrane protease [Polyangiales bacterium]
MSLSFALALAPAFLLLRMFQRMDAKRPEPPGSVRTVVLLGVASCIPAVIIELMLTALLGPATVNADGKLVNAFLVAATTEECLKLACVYFYLWKKPHFDEVMDGILYTAAASLGFAMLENVLYVGSNIGIAIMRALSAVPMHALCSAGMGYFIGRAKLARQGAALWCLAGLGFAISTHGAYDWALMSEGSFGEGPSNPAFGLLVAIAIVASAGVAVRLLYKHALKLDDALLGPYARPLATTTDSANPQGLQPYAGMPVLVHWADGNVYPASLVGGQGGHFLCAMPGGRQEWVPRERVRPA